jgi:hypothetical protein
MLRSYYSGMLPALDNDCSILFTFIAGRFRMERSIRATVGAFAAVAIMALPLSAQTNSFSPGDTYSSAGLTGFSTTGADMGGMLVTWTFAGGGTSFASWGDLGGGVWGVSSGGFSVTLGEATNTYGGVWSIFNGSDNRVSSVRFNGAPGRTLFDCDWNAVALECENSGSSAADFGTTGSAEGWSLESSGGTYTGGVSGFYTNAYAITGDPAVGDLFEQLTIRFDDILGVGVGYDFIADTDNSPSNVPPPQRVPEPGSIALLLSGLSGLAVMSRRRRA